MFTTQHPVCSCLFPCHFSSSVSIPSLSNFSLFLHSSVLFFSEAPVREIPEGQKVNKYNNYRGHGSVLSDFQNSRPEEGKGSTLTFGGTSKFALHLSRHILFVRWKKHPHSVNIWLIQFMTFITVAKCSVFTSANLFHIHLDCITIGNAEWYQLTFR